jgi:hypothetical protein
MPPSALHTKGIRPTELTLLAIRKWGREMLVCAVRLLVHRRRRVEGYRLLEMHAHMEVVRVHERAPSTESVPMLEREREATVQDRPIHLLSPPGFKTLGTTSSLPSRYLFPSPTSIKPLYT